MVAAVRHSGAARRHQAVTAIGFSEQLMQSVLSEKVRITAGDNAPFHCTHVTRVDPFAVAERLYPLTPPPTVDQVFTQPNRPDFEVHTDGARYMQPVA